MWRMTRNAMREAQASKATATAENGKSESENVQDREMKAATKHAKHWAPSQQVSDVACGVPHCGS